ncbi:endonuclease/exonuclease/phosphatase family protein [Muriicola sp. E247]|uniref:endonuclease/exonuclease/phosphatase family protein n=1 Tax=Muriicola sp. E247 TaxID=3242730 RepID=UPI00352630DE
MRFSKFTLYFVRPITVFLSLLLIVLCIYNISNQAEIILFELLLLLIPYLVAFNFITGLYASIIRSKLLIWPLVSLIIWIFVLGPFIVFSSTDEDKSINDISVLSFNALNFVGNYRIKSSNIQSEILNFVTSEDPDILCFQEFKSSRSTLKQLSNYPHYYIYPKSGTTDYAPLAIFSKVPIVAKGSLDFLDTPNNAIYVDLKVGIDTLRLYNIHLQSLRFRPSSIKRENPIRLIKRLGETVEKQKIQANQIIKHRKESSYPVVICGDFNNSQYSKVYSSLSKNMKDSFLEKGNGYGTTLSFKILPFRIDYILLENNFEVIEHKNYDVVLSDHYPIKATFRFQNP